MKLRRELGVFGAVMMGLGAMVGTGVFVSLGVAAGIAGSAAIIALVLAAGVAVCNALSSAQLAASLPVSGGTYEYGYAYLRPWVGFLAGWTFLFAKSASAATAALGFSGYLLAMLDGPPSAHVPLAAGAVAAVTLLVLGGMRRSSAANVAIVSVTILSLLAFVVAGLPSVGRLRLEATRPAAFLEATALLFVAYTGYARIATLGEEVREPRRTIPRAIVATLVVSMLLYAAVGVVAVASVGPEALGDAAARRAAPLEVAAAPAVRGLVAVGAMTAMLGVLLNLVLGLSRMLLAMGRRGDMPRAFARLDEARTTPRAAVLAVGAVVLGLSLLGDVKTTWSFSAFAVLVYYAVTNAAALALPAEARLYPRWVAVLGLAACAFLAFWVERRVWLLGLGLLAAGLLWRGVRRRRSA